MGGPIHPAPWYGRRCLIFRWAGGVIAAILLAGGCADPSPVPLSNAFYVWQQQWRPEMAEGLLTAALRQI